MDDDIPLCPPWWPGFLWNAEWHPRHPGGGGGSPVNRPAEIDDVLVALAVNVMSYRLVDQKRAGQIRALTVETITATTRRLGGHDVDRELSPQS